MTTNSDVYVRLKLDSQDFNKNMKKSTDKVEDFEKETKGAEKGLAGMTGAMASLGVATLAVGSAIIANSVRMGKLIESTDRYSRSTGIATKDLLAMNLAFRGLGVDAEDANEGLKTFAENIGDAIVNGSGPAKESLDRLGITLDELQGKSTDEQFLIFVDAMSKVETASERTFLAIQAGGEDFDRMNVLFDQGAGKLRELTEAQKEYTNALDLEKLRQTAEDTNKLMVAGDKLGLTFAGAVAPGLTKATDAATKYLEGIEPLMDFYVEWESKGFRGGLFDDAKGEAGIPRADALDARLKKMNDINVAEANFKKELMAEQALLLAKNKSEIKTTEQLERQFAIVRGMKDQAGNERAVSMEVLEQREQVLKLEAQVDDGQDFAKTSSLQMQGFLERGSAEEVSVRNQDKNEAQKQMLKEQQEQTKLLKKIASKRGNINSISI